MPERTHVRLAPIVIATVAVALAAAVLGALAMGLSRDIALPVGLCTALLSSGLVWLAARRTKAQAMVTCLLGGLAAGVLNTPLSFLVVSTMDSSSPVFGSLIGDLVAATVIGAVYAAPLGLAFGALYLVPTVAAQRMSREKTLEAVDRTLLVSGVWLVVLGVACGGVAALMAAESTRTLATDLAAAGIVAMIALGGAATAVSATRMWLRRRWFRDVSAGKSPRWAVLRTDPLVPWDAALPSLFAGAIFHDGLLCRREVGPGLGAYRTSDRLVPFAVVDLPGTDRQSRSA